VTDQDERIARNEALFRLVNERVRDLAGQSAIEAAKSVAFVCECGRPGCAESLLVPLADYERVRADPTHFVVVPGHATADVERVVERHEGYDVVRKHDEEAQIAIKTDPRS
jgi:hypothetical protein